MKKNLQILQKSFLVEFFSQSFNWWNNIKEFVEISHFEEII